MKITQLFKRVSEILSFCIFLSGSVVLVGWILNIPVLKSISPNFVTMKANVTICFILIGLSLWLSQAKRADNRLCRGIARFFAVIVFLIGFLSFWEYMLGWDFGIDQLLFKEPATAILTSSPGRMAFNTSIIFVIIGIALFMAGSETVLFSYLAQLLVVPAGIIALLSLVGYLYGASPYYISLKFSTAMAVHTSVLFIMSCAGCLLARPELGLMKDISSDNYGGMMLRRILPVVIVIPLVLGWFKINGEKTGLFGNEFGVSFVATCNLVAISLFVYVLSVHLNRLDIQRKQIETVLQTEKDNLEAVFEASPIGMLLLNEKAEVIRINGVIEKLVGKYCLGGQPGNLFGCIHSFEDPKGCGHSLFCPQCPIRNAIKTTLESGHSARCAEVLSTLLIDGKKTDVWLEVNAEPVVLDGEKCVIVAIRNITDRKQLEKEAKENIEVKSKFTSMVSHELRSPLGVIKEGINLVLEGLAGNINDEQRDLLDTAKKNTDRLTRLINNVLDFQKIEAGKMEFDIRENDINEVVLEINKAMSLAAEKRGLDLAVDVDDSIPKIGLDRDKIIQVLTNLVSNAIKYTEKGNITISTKLEDNTVHVIVHDTGRGIRAEDMQKLFQAFEQLDGSKDKKKGGTGLGLAISKEIILAHKGKIWAESEAGYGSSFHFILPLIKEGIFV